MKISQNAKQIAWIRVGDCIKCISHSYDTMGYPKVSRGTFHGRIARLILNRRFNRILSKDIVCRHTCDNSWCINPHHLVTGTQAENIRDRDIRGRTSLGERHYNCKLSWSEVTEIRNLKGKVKQSILADRFRVTSATISGIQRGVTRKQN